MKELEKNMRSIEMDGLTWGASKLVPVGFGIKKLQVNLVVEDEKVSIDDLQEQIASDEDHVQSTDVVSGFPVYANDTFVDFFARLGCDAKVVKSLCEVISSGMVLRCSQVRANTACISQKQETLDGIREPKFWYRESACAVANRIPNGELFVHVKHINTQQLI